MIPSCVEHFSFYASFFDVFLFQQVQDQPAKGDEIFSGVGRTARVNRIQRNYKDVFPAPLTLAQRAFAAAEIFALAAALMVRFLGGVLAAGFAVLTFAHRAFCPAAILARPAALILPFFLGALAVVRAGPPRIDASSLFNPSSFSLSSAARRS